jgi:hypothetical protein
VAIVEVVNEDSHFFWTFRPENFLPDQRGRLEKLYGDWLTRRHGSLEKAVTAWGGVRENGDDPAAGRMALYAAFMMTRQGFGAQPRKRQRVSDQVRFLSENMRGFYTETKRYFREQCDYPGLVSASNWHVADPEVLDALERYGYTAGDVIDCHGYFGGRHDGEGASYSVRVGHEFTSLAATTVPERLPLPFLQVAGYPHIISEIGWTNPSVYRADFAFLASTYGSLQGMDGYFTFALGGAFWDRTMNKFAASSPVIMGNFPAHALLYRRGDVREASDVVHQVLDLEELYGLKGSGAFTAQALDALRAADVPPGAEARGAVSAIDPLACYVGRVLRTFGKDTGASRQVNLSRYVDRERKTIRSVTGELFWDYGKGYSTVNAARAQGAAGFLARAGRIDLATVSIEMKNEYGSVTVVSLDDRPISNSRKLLIQAMTVERPYGFRATGANSGKILDLGEAPFGVEKIDGTVRLRLAAGGAPKVVALDEHGYPKPAPATVSGGPASLTVKLAPDSVYHVVQR